MKADLRRLGIQQIDKKLKPFFNLNENIKPDSGWIRAIREALNISQAQLGKKLKITKQGVRGLEMREQNRSITVSALEEVANALNMKLVYVLVPENGSFEKLIKNKAHELAKKIVMRTSNYMELEAQNVSKSRLNKAISDKTHDLIKEMPSDLWE